MVYVLIIIAVWIVIWTYNGLTGRHFAEDIVPWILFPIIIWRPIKALHRHLKRTHREREQTITKWSVLTRSESVQRRLMSGRAAVLGYTEFGVLYTDLDDARHLLVTGITGEGKTTIALNILQSLLLQGPTIFSKMTFSLHDAKNITALHYKKLTNLYPTKFQTHIKLQDSLDALNALVEEMLDRAQLLGDSLLFDIDELGLPHRLIIIDEPQLFYRRSTEYEKAVLELVTMGRQVGFHVLLMTPYSKSTIISTDYRPNFRYISGYLPKHAETVVQMPVSTLQKYHFFYQSNERDAAIKFRPFIIKPEDIQKSIEAFTGEQPWTAEEIALHVFKTVPNCGFRTLLKEGLALAEQVSADIPFPFNEVAGDGKHTQAARQWATNYLSTLTKRGLATKPKTGRARVPRRELA